MGPFSGVMLKYALQPRYTSPPSCTSIKTSSMLHAPYLLGERYADTMPTSKLLRNNRTHISLRAPAHRARAHAALLGCSARQLRHCTFAYLTCAERRV